MPKIADRNANPYDWAEPRAWTCPRCQVESITHTNAPKCPKCGAREDE
jgi:rubrerythrin